METNLIIGIVILFVIIIAISVVVIYIYVTDENDKCSTLSSCSNGFVKDPLKKEEECQAATCNADDDTVTCCKVQNPSAKAKCSTLSTCINGFEKDTTKNSLFCQAAKCNADDDTLTCCKVKNPSAKAKCSTLSTCSDGFEKDPANHLLLCQAATCNDDDDTVKCCKAYTRPTPPCPIGWYKDQKTDAHPTGDGLCHMKCPGMNAKGEFAQSRTDDSSCKCGLAEPNKQCWGYVAVPAEADVGINPFKCVDNADGVGGICRPK